MSTIPNAAEGAANPDVGKSAEQLWAEVRTETDSGSAETPIPAAAKDPAAPVVPPVVKEAVKPEPVAATAPAAPAVVDPYEGLSPGLKQKLTEFDQLANRTRKLEGHVGSLTAEKQRIADELAALKALPARQAPSQQQVAAAVKSNVKWEALAKDFPEWAEAVDERLSASTAQPDIEALRSQIREELTGSLTTDITAKVSAQIEKTVGMKVLNAVHPNWVATVNTPAFVEWQKAQPPEIQALAQSDAPEDAMAMIGSFKAQVQQAPAVDPSKVIENRRKQLADAASIARGDNAQLAPIKSTDDMTTQELWDFEKAERIRKQKANR